MPAAIIPVKRFGDAKQRCSTALDRPQRAALVEAMLTDVLEARRSRPNVERVIVVTSERRAERLALRHARRTADADRGLRRPRDRGPLGGGHSRDRPGEGPRRQLRGAPARGLPAARPRRARRAPSSACARAGSPSSPTATGPEPTRSCCRRPTRSGRRSGRQLRAARRAGRAGRIRGCGRATRLARARPRHAGGPPADGAAPRARPDRAPTTAAALEGDRPPRAARVSARVELVPVEGLPEVEPGDALGDLIAARRSRAAGTTLADGRRRRRLAEDRLEGRGPGRELAAVDARRAGAASSPSGSARTRAWSSWSWREPRGRARGARAC